MNLLAYGIALFMAIYIKFIFRYGNFQYVLYILKPVTKVVELFLGVSFQYYEGIGFINNDLKMHISRGCSGANFFIMVFLMISFSFISKIQNKNKLPALLIFFTVSYVITIIANASRIIGASLMMHIITFNIKYERLIHQSIGVIFYFIILIITYYLFSKMIDKGEKTHE
ncbi:exosortase K [Crassaminicella profunda]|uniref:exosortase K n=1 Tax=Crassaminicella profunda TaxID=1286698 RepID=UPI001CA6BD21|nr:exosortase K [Crassaminicella profunda]QZY55743.1 exosortase K [Crassaminicella profunda]